MAKGGVKGMLLTEVQNRAITVTVVSVLSTVGLFTATERLQPTPFCLAVLS